MGESDREKILERIRHLVGRTTSRGCTEAEAMAAAAKAAELMAAYGLVDGDVSYVDKRVPVKSNAAKWPALWAAIGLCTTNAVTIGMGRHGSYVEFVGVPAGTQIAAYLVQVCERAIEREATLFKAGPFYRRRRSVATKRAALADFRAGMIDRVGTRLLTLFEQTIEAGEDDLKAARAERDRRNPRAVKASLPEHKERYAQATDAGYMAGARPTLAHGVGGSSGSPKLIGRA